jgi:hypothetical protein
MKLKALYKIKVESYRDFRNHLLQCFLAYCTSIGLLGYFAFQSRKENQGQFLVLWVLLVVLLSFGLYLSKFYLRHAHITAEHVEKLSEHIKIQLDEETTLQAKDYAEDGVGMREAMWSFAAINVVAWLASVIVLAAALLKIF